MNSSTIDIRKTDDGRDTEKKQMKKLRKKFCEKKKSGQAAAPSQFRHEKYPFRPGAVPAENGENGIFRSARTGDVAESKTGPRRDQTYLYGFMIPFCFDQKQVSKPASTHRKNMNTNDASLTGS